MPVKYEKPDPKLPCICEGNWRLIIAESEPFFNRRYKNESGKEYIFYGVVHADDDYYYGMCDNEGKCLLLSCVSLIEGHGFSLI